MIRIYRYGNLWGSYKLLLINDNNKKYCILDITGEYRAMTFKHVMKIVNVMGGCDVVVEYELSDLKGYIEELKESYYEEDFGALL